MKPGALRPKLANNLEQLEALLGVGDSFDVIVRRVEIGGRQAAFLWIDGLVDDDVMARIMQVLFQAEREDLSPRPIDTLAARWLAYLELEVTDRIEQVVARVMAGPVILLVDGDPRALVIDSRTYPARGPAEPDLERVVRGSRDGFVETLVFNTALIRRRIRDPNLRFELVPVGRRSRTDTVIAYIKDVADSGLVRDIKSRLEEIEIDGLPMAEKTIEEFLTGRRLRWNPVPVVRFTERPDVAAVHLLEGHLIVIVDTSPSVLILPVTLFHHLQHAEEYRVTPLVGVYERWIRLAGMLLALVGPPLWAALALSHDILPPAFAIIGPRDPGVVPLVVQLFIGDFALDLLRLALIHTPTALATSLGLIGAVLLGELAIGVGLLSAEAVLYLAIAALGTFATPSMEFGLAMRLGRLFLLTWVAVFRLPGLALGSVLVFLYLLRLRSFGVPYLWPLLPFDGPALSAVLIRRPIMATGTRPRMLHPRDPDRRPSLAELRRRGRR